MDEKIERINLKDNEIMLNCAILAIGSELMEGSVVDTNSTFISSRLSKLGFKVDYMRQLPDDVELLVGVISDTMKKYPLVLTTGGLGPTFDDLTAAVVAKATARDVVRNEKAYKHMYDRLTALNVEINQGHNHQVMLPAECLLFDNKFGTALGFGVEYKSSIVISMPGVPYEMKPMFDDYVIPFILKKFAPSKIYFKDIVFANIPESRVDDEILRLKIPHDVQAIINAGKGLVTVKLRGADEEQINNMASHLAKVFDNNFVAYDGSSLQDILFSLCMRNKKTLAFAESCTGGLLSELITAIPGSSDVFLGSVVSYSNEAKINLLGVDKNILDTHGAVSSEVAYLMAKGARDKFGADYAVSITGIAGPTGATADKKVGLVYLGFATKTEIKTVRLDLTGDRDAIRMRSVNSAMFKLIEIIKN